MTATSCLGNADRRRPLRYAPGSLAWTLAGGLLGAGRVASAEPLPASGVPAVDTLAIRVGTTLSKTAGPRTLQNEWGLSLHLASSRGAEPRQVLIDFGFTGDTLNGNLGLLAIDPGQLDALVLSHGHYDHFDGLVGFLERHRGRLKPELPFLLGGEECFCTREGGIGANVGSFGSLDRQAIADAKLTLQFAGLPRASTRSTRSSAASTWRRIRRTTCARRHRRSTS